MSKLTEKEAFAAMFAFLEHRFSLTASDDLASLLGGMSLLPDGAPADAALWQDWLNAVHKAKAGEVRGNLDLR